MTSMRYPAAYRATIYAPRSEQTLPASEVDVLTPRAGALHSDAFRVWTRATSSDWKGYLLPPRGRKSALSLRERKADSGSLELEILDKRLGTANDERWLTQFFTSASGEARLHGCLVLVEESLDDGCSWQAFFTGRVKSVVQKTRQTWAIALRDIVEDWKREIFVGPPATDVSTYATLATLIPHHNVVTYHNIPGRGRVPGRIRSTGAGVDGTFELNNGAPYDRWCIVSKALTQQADDVAYVKRAGGFRSTSTLVLMSFTAGKVRARVRNTGTLAEGHFDVVSIRCRTDKVHAIAQYVSLQEIDPAAEGYATWASIGASGAAIDVTLYATGPLEGQHAILINDVHPVQLLADLCDGYYGRLQADGSPMFTIRRDASNPVWASMIADLSWETVSFIIQKEESFADWVQEKLCKPFGLAVIQDASGYLVPKDLRPSALSGLSTITDDDVIADESGEDWTQDAGGALNLVRYDYWGDFAQDDFVPSRDDTSFPDSAPGLIESVQASIVAPGRAANLIDLGVRFMKVAADGLRYSPDYVSVGSSANATRAANKAAMLAGTWLDQYARGARTLTLTCRRTPVPTALERGDAILLDVSTVLNPDTLTYGGTVLARCTSKEENGAKIVLGFELAGVSTQATAPTIGTPTLGTATDLGAIVQALVTLNASSEPAEVMFAATDTSASRPIDSDPLWTSWVAAYATGTVSSQPLQSGTRVWVRARTRPSLLSSGYKQPSAWVYPAGTGYVDTPALATPGSPAIGNLTATTAELTWTGGTDGALVELLVHTGSNTTVWSDNDVVATLPAPPRAYTFTGLTASTTYAWGVRFIDPQGGRSAVAGVTDSTTGSVTTAPAIGGIGFAYWSSIELQVYPGDPSYDIELERAPDLAGAPDTGNSVTFYIPRDGRYNDPLPPDGATWWYRARHRLVSAGVTDGPWLDWVAAVARSLPTNDPDAPNTDPTTPVIIVPVPPTIAIAQSQSAGTGTLTVTITDPQLRVKRVEFQTYDDATATTSAWTTDSSIPYSTTVPYSSGGISIIRYRITGTDPNGITNQVLAQGEVYFTDATAAGALDDLSDVDTTTTTPGPGAILAYHAPSGQWRVAYITTDSSGDVTVDSSGNVVVAFT